jgi:imidazoleglycerol-phosphate dehydratase
MRRGNRHQASNCIQPALGFVFPGGICLYSARMRNRLAQIRRVTKETRISLELDIDGKGTASVQTGIPFLDHMLTLFSKHAVMDLDLRCQGDLDVDSHHTVEDCGIALGQAFLRALGDKKGIRRYGTGFDPRNPFTGEAHVPMDECLARCVVDFSGRPHLIWRGMNQLAHKSISKFDKAQDMSSAFRFGLAREFFQGFTNEARCNLHLELLYGDEPHHIVEALFKAFAKAVDVACQRDPRISGRLPSTKGKL